MNEKDNSNCSVCIMYNELINDISLCTNLMYIWCLEMFAKDTKDIESALVNVEKFQKRHMESTIDKNHSSTIMYYLVLYNEYKVISTYYESTLPMIESLLDKITKSYKKLGQMFGIFEFSDRFDINIVKHYLQHKSTCDL